MRAHSRPKSAQRWLMRWVITSASTTTQILVSATMIQAAASCIPSSGNVSLIVVSSRDPERDIPADVYLIIFIDMGTLCSHNGVVF